MTTPEQVTETIRARVQQALVDVRANASWVHQKVISDGGEFVSVAYVYKILRGADDEGSKADRIRKVTAEITGKSIEVLFGTPPARGDSGNLHDAGS